MSAEKAEFTLVKSDEDAALNSQNGRKKRRRRKACIAVTVVIVIVLVAAAFIGGYLVRRALKLGCDEDDEDSDHEKPELDSLHKEAIKGISKERIEEDLK